MKTPVKPFSTGWGHSHIKYFMLSSNFLKYLNNCIDIFCYCERLSSLYWIKLTIWINGRQTNDLDLFIIVVDNLEFTLNHFGNDNGQNLSNKNFLKNIQFFSYEK